MRPRIRSHARRTARPSRRAVRVVALTPPAGAPAPPAAAAAAATATPPAEVADAPTRRLAPDGVLAAPLPSPPLTGGGGDEPPPLRPLGGGGDGDGEGEAGSWNPLERLAAGIRARVAADPDFAFKIAVECGLDAAIIVGVNVAARGARLLAEADLVASQVAVSLLNDCALVYLLAPRRRRGSGGSARWARLTARLPAHVFQSGPFSPAARAACFGVRAVQYGALGAASGVVGGGLIEGLTAARAATDPAFALPATYAPPLATGAVWAYFMSLSSNVRYNLVNGAEAAVAAAAPGAAKGATVALRLANNWAGATHFMHVADRLGLNRPRSVTAA